MIMENWYDKANIGVLKERICKFILISYHFNFPIFYEIMFACHFKINHFTTIRVGVYIPFRVMIKVLKCKLYEPLKFYMQALFLLYFQIVLDTSQGFQYFILTSFLCNCATYWYFDIHLMLAIKPEAIQLLETQFELLQKKGFFVYSFLLLIHK